MSRSTCILFLLTLSCSKGGEVIDSAPVVFDQDGDSYDRFDDCDDAEASVFPGAEERCDGLDNDCDGDTDEGLSALWYADADADSYGDPLTETWTCAPAAGAVSQSGDCDDADPSVHPGAEERCDDRDEDCDSVVDEDAVDAPSWGFDSDGDGYGGVGITYQGCDGAVGFVENQDDCDDASADNSPVGEERCDELDNDCDALVDEGFQDFTGDGLPDCTQTVTCTELEDFTTWTLGGNGRWSTNGLSLYEGRSGSYSAVAYTDTGVLWGDFWIEVEVAWGGSLNDTVGLVFALDPNAYTYWAVRWDDPQGSYGRYSPTGAMLLSYCTAAGCTDVASEAADDLSFPADGSFATWRADVSDDAVVVSVDGEVVLSAVEPQIVGLGPGIVGLHSYDNDGGVTFQSYCVGVVQ